MNFLIKKSHFILGLLTALLVAACGGVGGGLAGIGGSGYVSSGTVTSFGSVFVNGVEFNTNSSTYEIEGDTGLTQADLRIGMVVQVSGSINSDGITGTATHINYGDDLQGPVSGISTAVAVDTRSFTVFGKTVLVSVKNTAFEGVAFVDIVDGNVLEISGFYDQLGVLQASYVKLQAALSNADSVFEIKGKISSLSGSNFQVRGVSVEASNAVLSGLTNGLQNNLLVEVAGTFVSGVIVATKVEAEQGLSEDAEVEMEGIVTRYVDNSDFDVNGQKVNASNASFSPADLTLKMGMKIEIAGLVSNGVLNVSEVEAREGSAQVSAKVSSKTNNSFTVEVLTEQFVTVNLNTATRMDDNLLLSELIVGDFVVVQGLESGASSITATSVKRESEVKETELQGVVSASTVNSLTVLGVTYPVDVNTSYDGVNDHAGLLDLITNDPTIVISISDDIPLGAVNEVEIVN